MRDADMCRAVAMTSGHACSTCPTEAWRAVSFKRLFEFYPIANTPVNPYRPLNWPICGRTDREWFDMLAQARCANPRMRSFVCCDAQSLLPNSR
jgi:hypothetical protein